ncbi:MAG TPA: hypothetical protein VIV88_18780 [Gemmatimonadales bacterium]
MIELQNRSFEIHSLDIQLTAGSERFPSFRGPGSIRQNSKGMITFELYDPTREPDFGRQPGTGAPGDLVPEGHYYKLSAVDLEERHWTAERILPHHGGRIGVPGVVCSGVIREIQCPEAGKADHWLRLFIPGSFDIPANYITKQTRTRSALAGVPQEEEIGHSTVIDTWKLDLQGLHVIVEVSEKGLLVTTWSDSELSAGLDSRLEETLWFVLAHPCRWLFKMESRGGHGTTAIRSHTSTDFKSRLRPPVDWAYIPVECVTILFQQYLAYLQVYKEPRFHPTSVNVLQVLRGSAQSIEAEALALGVAIESLLNRDYADCGQPLPQDRAQVDRLESLINQSTLSYQIKNRALGAVSRLKSTSAGTCLRQMLGHTEHVTTELIAAWSKIRNATAHGEDISEPFEEIVSLCNKAYVLFNVLIFNRIGFVGEYKNRALPKWPEVKFAPFWPPPPT